MTVGGSIPGLLAASLAAACLMWPRTAPAKPEMSELGEAWRRLESYEVSGARGVIDGFLAKNPDDPTAVYLSARAAFYAGDYQKAVTLLGKTGRIKVMGMDEDFRQLAEDTAAAVSTLSPSPGEHFVLTLDERKDWVLAKPALEVLEKSYSLLGGIFGVYPEGPVRVEIYPDPDDFQKVSSLSKRDIETSGAIGICKYNKIMMLSPRCLAAGYRWKDTLAHEYLHYLVVRLTGNNAPIWVQEGVAQYFENRWKGNASTYLWPVGAALLAKAIEEGNLVPFEAMDPSLVKLDSMAQVSLAFAECATAVDYLLSRAGSEGFLAFLRRIGTLAPGLTRQALRETMGLEFTEFEKAWKAHVAGLGLRKIEHLSLPDFRLAGEAAERDILDEIKSQTARNYLLLGDQMRKGGRLKPALVEYKRAYRDSPGSPYIINKVAVASVLLEDYETAFEYLGKALEMAPDYPWSYLNYGDALVRSGKPQEALRYLREYNEINPYNPGVYVLSGRAHSLGGRKDAALADWETAVRLAPSNDRLREEIEVLKRELQQSGG